MTSPNKIPQGFYIFCSQIEDQNSNSRIKIIDSSCPFSGVVFVINHIKLEKTLFKGYNFDYNYSIIEQPENKNIKFPTKEFEKLVGDIVLDVWERYYA